MAAQSKEEASVEQLLMGLLAVLVADREERGAESKDRRKTEVVLDSVGLSAPTIATLMNKTVDAVRKTIQRSR